MPSARAVAPGAPLTVTVRGYDDQGAGAAIAGAAVTLGTATATTDTGGRATITAPAGPGAEQLVARKKGTVQSFPVEVAVG